MKFSLAHTNPGERSTDNFTPKISRHLQQRKTEKRFTSALLQGSCSEKFFKIVLGFFLESLGGLSASSVYQTTKSTHHPHKIDDQHCECETGGGAYFTFFLGSDNSHTTPSKSTNLMRKVFCGDDAWFPKDPRHTKSSTRSEFTIRSEFTTRSDSLLKM